MRKIITINDCEECKFVWYYLGIDACCILENKKHIPLNEDGIPEWCPLLNASKEMIKMELDLTKSKGLDFTYEDVIT